MFNSKFPVPPAFIITSEGFADFISKIKKEIHELIEKTEFENTKQLNETSKKIRELIEKQEMSKEMRAEILEAYETLGTERQDLTSISADALSILKLAKEPVFVAVRSSATTEDLATASFAGQQESFLGIKGNEKLIHAVKKCFSSLYTPRAIYYREKKGFHKAGALLAVVVQRMINSDKSGVMFTKNPIHKDDNVMIEAVFGLGEGIVSGQINPDEYLVNKELEILEKKIADKKKALVRSSSGETEEVKLTEERSVQQVLTEGEIKKIADFGLKIEEHYKKPQDIEFAIENREIYIVQSRPITTTAKLREKELEGKILLTGLAASPGIGSGKVKIVKSMADLDKIRKGDILVTEMTNPDMVVTMQKSDGIVTDEGGATSHAAIVSREMGIPCVVGTKNATKILQDGQVITVDGGSGRVYEGIVGREKKEDILPIVETRTKIKVILDLPDFAERAAKTKCKDVGLLRLEGIIAESGKHPLLFLAENRMDAYRKILENGIEKIAKHFHSIWVRTSDIRSDEFRNLQGSPKEQEINPMLGFHGIRFSLKNRQILEAEIQAVKNIAEKYREKEFGIMIPQVISVGEISGSKKIFEKFKKENMKFGIMVETPAACQIIPELCDEGIDFISFGTNDLTQFTLAVDRGNENVQDIYSEMHPAVLREIKYVIKICREKGVETSICGQAASKPEMARFLVERGIDSISVNADSAYEISKLVQQLEQVSPVKYEERIIPVKKEKQAIQEQQEYPDVDIGIDVFSHAMTENEEVSEKEQKQIKKQFQEEKKKFEETEEIKEKRAERAKRKEKEEYSTDMGFDFFKPMMIVGSNPEERPVLCSVVKEQQEGEEEKDEVQEIIDELQGKKDKEDIDIEKDEDVLDIF